jgi:hypothetical protein
MGTERVELSPNANLEAGQLNTYEKRKDADYELHYQFKPGSANRMVSEIKEFLKDLETEI